MASSTLALKEALLAVLPSIEFEDEELEYFLSSLEEGGSDTAVADNWKPILIGRSAASDDSSADELCIAILNRLRASAGDREASASSQESKTKQDASVDGLSRWLKELRLDQYNDEVTKWCIAQDIKDLNGLREKSEALLKDVNFKRCEVTRVQRAVEAMEAEGGQNGTAVVDDRLRQEQIRPLLIQFGLDGDTETFGEPPYAIKEELGKGASAQVFRCLRLSKSNGGAREFAVKIVGLRHYKLHDDHKQRIERLMSEISFLLSLQHPNIASLHDVVHDSNQSKLYLVMELVRGGDLFEYIKSSKCLTEDKACDIFLQLADALRYIHSKNIVHRDLKPENILVDKSSSNHPQVKITDFGASKFSDDGYSTSHTRVGTEQYWAPEVQETNKNKKKGYNEKVDLWSLGVVLYVMLTGGYPFYDEAGESMSKKIQEGKFKFDTNKPISKEARDLIKNLLKPNPIERFSLEQCFSHPWAKKYARNSTTSSREDSAEDCEESISLPADVKDVKLFRSDLSSFTIGFKFAATLRGKREIVVRWKREGPAPSDETLEKARLELQKILSKHFEGFSLPSRMQSRQSNGLRGSGYQVGKPLATVIEEK
jgi:serine/threonine protein kinase